MSESIIQTHTSSLLEEGGGGQRRMRGREGGRKKRERRELKMGEGEMERKMCPGFHINLYVP